jgi:CO/xanthine dehydrogenase FAD-binding subunit
VNQVAPLSEGGLVRKLRPFEYFRPASLDEALEILHHYGAAARVLAGGTDLLVSLKNRRGPAPEALVDLKGVSTLDYCRSGDRGPTAARPREIASDGLPRSAGARMGQHASDGGFRLGALFTIDSVTRHPEIQARLGLLRTAAFAIGHPQVRSCATVVGNLCNASPSADMAPSLLALDARLTIARAGATRTLPLTQFYAGPFRHVLEPDEIVTEIEVPALPARTGGHYGWLSKLTAVDETLVGGAAVVSLEDGDLIADARIALGSMAPTPIRAWKAEEYLRGRRVEPRLVAEAARIAADEANPRRRADYRREMTRTILERTVHTAVQAAN